MDYCIITPTRERPECLKLLSHLINKQTILPLQWIVVDESKDTPDLPSLPYLQYIKRIPQKNDPIHTVTVNMLEALKNVNRDAEIVLIFEDDDWYREDYAEQMLNSIKNFDVIGNRPTIHYNLHFSHYKILAKKEKACWCKTGFKTSIIPIVQQIIQRDINNYLIDMPFWGYIKNNKKPYILLDTDKEPIHIGFKGMKGYKSTYWMHVQASSPNNTFTKDTNHIQLQKWIKEDYKLYKDMI